MPYRAVPNAFTAPRSSSRIPSDISQREFHVGLTQPLKIASRIGDSSAGVFAAHIQFGEALVGQCGELLSKSVEINGRR